MCDVFIARLLMADFVDLESKLLHPEQIAEFAVDYPSLLQDLLKGVEPQHQKSTRRENCSKSLMYMAETWPQTLLITLLEVLYIPLGE
jgi:hypothetical protein